jgi:hypothetical protein
LRLIVLGIAAALLLALAASQLLLAGYLEHRIENRLTADGGSASVTLEALPALRLLAHDGDRLVIEGQNLRIDPKLSDLTARSLDDLDGFDEVELRLRGLEAGPFRVHVFDLGRAGDADTYRLQMTAATSPRELLGYGSAQLPGLLGPLVGGAAATVLQGRGQIPIDFDAELASDGGRPRVVSARGTVVGIQVGPLVQLLAGAVLSRL